MFSSDVRNLIDGGGEAVLCMKPRVVVPVEPHVVPSIIRVVIAKHLVNMRMDEIVRIGPKGVERS